MLPVISKARHTFIRSYRYHIMVTLRCLGQVKILLLFLPYNWCHHAISWLLWKRRMSVRRGKQVVTYNIYIFTVFHFYVSEYPFHENINRYVCFDRWEVHGSWSYYVICTWDKFHMKCSIIQTVVYIRQCNIKTLPDLTAAAVKYSVNTTRIGSDFTVYQA